MGSKLKQAWWSRPLGHFLWLVITLVCLTLRKRVNGNPDHLRKRQVIVALWHSRIFVPCYFYRYIIKGSVTMSMLTSASKDGAMLSAVAEDYGMRAVRGSSHRRGAIGFLDMVRELKDGCSMCITPDGPKGPVYQCHPGAIKLASISGVPIVPLRIHYSRAHRMSTWDHFHIPMPFSKATIDIQEPLHVPADLNDEQLAEWRRKLEEALTQEDSARYRDPSPSIHSH